jgi:hypothetical protein
MDGFILLCVLLILGVGYLLGGFRGAVTAFVLAMGSVILGLVYLANGPY